MASPELQIPTRKRKNNRGRWLAVVGCLWFCGGCGIHRQAAGEAVVREYVRLVVALGEHDPDWLDYYDGPPEWVADVRRHPPPLGQIKDAAGALIVRLRSKDQLLPAPRAEFLTKQLVAIQVRTDLLAGIRRSFDQEAEAFSESRFRRSGMARGLRLSAPSWGACCRVPRPSPGATRLLTRSFRFPRNACRR